MVKYEKKRMEEIFIHHFSFAYQHEVQCKGCDRILTPTAWTGSLQTCLSLCCYVCHLKSLRKMKADWLPGTIPTCLHVSIVA